MLVTKAKLGLMERALRHLGGEIESVSTKTKSIRRGILHHCIIWEAERNYKDTSGMLKVIFYQEVKGDQN